MNHSLARRAEHRNQHAAPARGTADNHPGSPEKQAGFLRFQTGLKELVSSDLHYRIPVLMERSFQAGQLGI